MFKFIFFSCFFFSVPCLAWNTSSLVKNLKRTMIGQELAQEFTKKFSPVTLESIIKKGQNSYSKDFIYINNQLDDAHALSDLAHELTHYLFKEQMVMDANITLTGFIYNALEAQGGEVEAFMNECALKKETPLAYTLLEISKCQFETRSELSAKFYALGEYYHSFFKILFLQKAENNFPKLSKNKVVFVSADQGVPYPIALYLQYQRLHR